jgi:2-keto-3-deoxy-L-rhamnonate aldolase RhmA
VEEAIETIVRKARAAVIPIRDGQAMDDPTQWLNQGARILAIGNDEMFVGRSAYAALDRFQDVVGAA